jgi:hypothetical protein
MLAGRCIRLSAKAGSAGAQCSAERTRRAEEAARSQPVTGVAAGGRPGARHHPPESRPGRSLRAQQDSDIKRGLQVLNDASWNTWLHLRECRTARRTSTMHDGHVCEVRPAELRSWNCCSVNRVIKECENNGPITPSK